MVKMKAAAAMPGVKTIVTTVQRPTRLAKVRFTKKRIPSTVPMVINAFPARMEKVVLPRIAFTSAKLQATSGGFS